MPEICANCSDWDEYVRTEIFDMTNYNPSFPGCSLIVEYCYSICRSVPPDAPCEQCVKYHILSIQPTYPYCAECENLFNFLNSGEYYEKEVKARNLISYLTLQIMIRNFTEFVNGLPSFLRKYCDEKCYAKYYSYLGNCQAICYVHHPIGYDAEWLIKPVDCVTGEYCCIREYLFCLERETGNIRFSQTIKRHPNIDCYQMRIQISDCPAGEHVEILQCFDNCAH